MITISRGQMWINNYTGQTVIIQGVEEYKLELKTPSGFTYTYPFDQFIKEYRNAEGNVAAR